MSKSVDRAIETCESRYPRDLFRWQDCARGVNIAKRLLKRVSPETVAKSASKLCASAELFPGPRSRCVQGVKLMVKAVKRLKR